MPRKPKPRSTIGMSTVIDQGLWIGKTNGQDGERIIVSDHPGGVQWCETIEYFSDSSAALQFYANCPQARSEAVNAKEA